MAKFDSTTKQIFRKHTADLVHFVLSENVEVIEILDADLPIVEDRSADCLAKVNYHDREIIIHIEFQTSDSTKTPMPRRMAEYVGRLIARYNIPIHATVIYLRPDAGRNDLGKYEFSIGNSDFSFKYNVIRLAEIDGRQILNSNRIGQLPFSPLTKPPSNTEPNQWIRQCVQTIDQIETDRQTKLNALNELAILGGLIFDHQSEISSRRRSCKSHQLSKNFHDAVESADFRKERSKGSDLEKTVCF